MTCAMTNLKPRADFAKCAGQAENGVMLCAYRTGCARFIRPSAENQCWANFWLAGDDCPQYVSITPA